MIFDKRIFVLILWLKLIHNLSFKYFSKLLQKESVKIVSSVLASSSLYYLLFIFHRSQLQGGRDQVITKQSVTNSWRFQAINGQGSRGGHLSSGTAGLRGQLTKTAVRIKVDCTTTLRSPF